ncbi:MAG: M48 family metalloprotease [Gammaproteobacteria bacterium]|nr:M48 family metalloprotease [Gammaproteobacteria bacterium]
MVWVALFLVAALLLSGPSRDNRAVEKLLLNTLTSQYPRLTEGKFFDDVKTAVTQLLQGSTNLSAVTWNIVVVDSDHPFILAIPDNTIVIADGMATTAFNKHALGGLIAHEMAHHLSGETPRRFKAALFAQSSPNTMSTWLSILSQKPEGTSIVTSIINQLSLTPYTAAQESEAEQIALSAMIASCLEPSFLSTAWKNTRARSGSMAKRHENLFSEETSQLRELAQRKFQQTVCE